MTATLSPSKACRQSNAGEETELAAHETSPGASRIQGGGSEMELLSSQQEIICLIKDFPPSYPLGQSEVLHQGESEMIKRAPWAFRAGQRRLPCLHSRAKEDLFNPTGKV